MKNNIILASLTVLMMGSALQAMDRLSQFEPSRLNERLITAAIQGNKEMIIDLLAQGADVNAAHEYGTALIDTVLYAEDKEEICKLLLSHGADVNAKDQWDRSALLYIGLGDDEGLMNKLYKLLLSYGADVNAQGKDGWTALLMACDSGQTAIVKFLLDTGANFYAQNKGETALMLAAQKGHKAVCKLLINAMIKPTKEEIDSIVALLGSSKKKRSEQLNVTTHDVVKLIGRERYNVFRREHRPEAEIEIKRIRNEEMKQELLGYLNSL